MTPEERERLQKMFGHFSRAELQHRISKGGGGIDVGEAHLWMEVLADDEREAARKRADESVEIARKAAQNSSRSARYAMYAAWISLAGIFLQVVRSCSMDYTPMTDERPIERIELYPFSYFDLMRRRWVRARYVAELEAIATRYAAFRIIGAAEVREGPRDSRILSDRHLRPAG